MNRKLRMGMVGGGRGAFIGAVHRMAANLDGKIELVAGAFSSSPEKSKLSGEDFFLDPERVYESYQEMAEKEAAREDKIDFVSIVVQNHLHFDVAKTFLEAGFNVICDKPMTRTLEEARALRDIVDETGQIFCLTHNYTGYPMVKEARRMVKDGEIGRILKIVAEYPQGYAVGDVEGDGQGQISNWRSDPKIAGSSNCMGDIGTHAHNLVRYITGLEIEEMCSELTAFIPGRELDDDGNNLIRFEGGAKGIIYASQISNGDENALNIRVYGTKASLEWHQEDPNELIVKYANAPRKFTVEETTTWEKLHKRILEPHLPTQRALSRPLPTSIWQLPKPFQIRLMAIHHRMRDTIFLMRPTELQALLLSKLPSRAVEARINGSNFQNFNI